MSILPALANSKTNTESALRGHYGIELRQVLRCFASGQTDGRMAGAAANADALKAKTLTLSTCPAQINAELR
jgi:hypothetical protein